jgi:hypothetical protein
MKDFISPSNKDNKSLKSKNDLISISGNSLYTINKNGQNNSEKFKEKDYKSSNNGNLNSKFDQMSDLMGNECKNIYLNLEKAEENLLKCKILANSNVIKEYENWINLLLNVINVNQNPQNFFDLANHLHEKRKKIEDLGRDNLEINKMIIREKDK